MGQGAALNEQDLISVVMNCYNGERFLSQAVESVIGQTWKNWELIFWDNQSTDRSAEIFRSYDDPRLKYFYAPTHTLLYEARNYALEMASGDFYAFLDVDDWWTPDKLERQMPHFDDPDVGVVCGNYWVSNELKDRSRMARTLPAPQGWVLEDLLQDYFVALLTLMVRKTAVETLKSPFDPRYHVIGDLDMVVRLSAKWKLAYVHEAIAYYRIHGSNETGRHRARHIQELETWAGDMCVDASVGPVFKRSGFSTQLAYIKAMDELLQNNKRAAFDLLKNMRWGRLKWRLLLALLLPLEWLQKVKN